MARKLLRPLLAFAAILLNLAICSPASGTQNSSTDPLVGKWYSGDGLGLNIYISFRLDGTYTADWFGCLGRYGRASGRWARRDTLVELTPKHEEDMLKGYLRRLELIGTEELFRLVAKNDGTWQRAPGDPFTRQKESRRGMGDPSPNPSLQRTIPGRSPGYCR